MVVINFYKTSPKRQTFASVPKWKICEVICSLAENDNLRLLKNEEKYLDRSSARVLKAYNCCGRSFYKEKLLFVFAETR